MSAGPAAPGAGKHLQANGIDEIRVVVGQLFWALLDQVDAQSSILRRR
jgi:hypothetical protein